ncbi:hypothetical protein Trydic_g11443 [Trypoxylus dichotomus]
MTCRSVPNDVLDSAVAMVMMEQLRRSTVYWCANHRSLSSAMQKRSSRIDFRKCIYGNTLPLLIYLSKLIQVEEAHLASGCHGRRTSKYNIAVRARPPFNKSAGLLLDRFHQCSVFLWK